MTMRNLSRNKVLTVAAFLLLSVTTYLTACKKFLDKKPLGAYTTDNYPYPPGSGRYDQFVFTAYSGIRDYQVSCYPFIGALIRSDDAMKGSSLFDGDGYGLIASDNFTMNPSTPFANDLWKGYIGLISKCNTVLSEVGKDTTNTPEATKTLARAEARFIRGYAYFTFERLFGNVPIIDTVLTVSGSNVPQSTPAEVYAFIEQDLQFAAANLPATWDPKFIGRATTGAANGLLAKVFLYEKKWSNAMAAAGIVINSGLYNLKTPYADIFTDAGENSSESVFEVQCYADANTPTNYGCQYSEHQGVRGVGTQDLGWGFNNPSPQLAAAYEPGDPREASTVLHCPTPAGTTTRYGEVFGRPEPNDSTYNMKVYTDPAARLKVGGLAGQHAWWVNLRLLRYADVVLIYAEAANELGQTTEALEKLEWVRARARGGNNSILPAVTATDQSLLRSAIQHERMIEFAMEFDRFFDIVRWDIADTVLHAAGKINYTKGRDEWLPVPQVQISLSNGVLHQNPGW